MTVLELENSKQFEQITYNDLLSCDEWRDKRKEIIKRDLCGCNKCLKPMTKKLWLGPQEHINIIDIENQNYKLTGSYLNKPVNLEVHHSYYIINCFPWNYPNASLLTVCRDCHQKIHDECKIPIWDENMVNKIKFGECERCLGKGYILQYDYFKNGRCFKCGGSGHNIPFQYKKKV